MIEDGGGEGVEDGGVARTSVFPELEVLEGVPWATEDGHGVFAVEGGGGGGIVGGDDGTLMARLDGGLGGGRGSGGKESNGSLCSELSKDRREREDCWKVVRFRLAILVRTEGCYGLLDQEVGVVLRDSGW